MEIVTDGNLPFIPEPQNTNASPSDIGIAVDIGTTTIAAQVWSISQRKLLATIAEQNKQIRYGHDVIKRMSFALRTPAASSAQMAESGMSTLHYCILSQLEKMFQTAVAACQTKLPRGFQPKITSIVMTGNTTMLNFVNAIPVKSLSQAPFTPECKYDFETTWKLMREGLSFEKHCVLDSPTPEIIQVFESSIVPDETKVYFPPCIGALIGADTVCAMIAAGFPIPGSATNFKSEGGSESEDNPPPMLIDLGTNSEIALYIADTPEKKGRILCTATAAGPAFEAANISCGMSAVDGAIDKVTIDKGEIISRTIGNKNAKGICGSGLVSAVANLYEHKYIDKNGAILKAKSALGDNSPCIELTPAVYISQQDIRNLQLAKSAVKTGLAYLLERSPVTPRLKIAGGFGARLSLDDAKKISLIPSELVENAVQIGNGALSGASALLFSKVLRLKARELTKKSIPINLAAVAEFQERFLKSIDF